MPDTSMGINFRAVCQKDAVQDDTDGIEAELDLNLCVGVNGSGLVPQEKHADGNNELLGDEDASMGGRREGFIRDDVPSDDDTEIAVANPASNMTAKNVFLNNH
ncbi:hypothetical protein BBP40_000918 [Aspergillus hancockii]|nr:hypothetical protein BBP40_000918 [Aspergillus hancockii]